MASLEPVYLHLSPEFPQAIITLVIRHQIKMVYWDFGGTIVDLSPEIKERAVKKINRIYHRDIDVQMFDQAIKAEWRRRETRQAKKEIKAVNDELKERQYWVEFYTSVLKNLEIRVKNQQIVKWLATMQQNPDSFEELPHVRATIRKLREIGVSVGIISNAFPSARNILEKNGLKREFDDQHVILSYEYNSIKPERSIYQEAIDQAGVKPHEILFIDDRRSFVDGAVRHGMKAVIINDNEGKNVNGSGKSKFEMLESFDKKIFSLVWSWNRWLKGIRNRSARLKTGILWQQRAPGYSESLSLHPEM